MRHRFHSLCPYFAMFPESFAQQWIEKLSKPGDLVLDPFSGRGTTPFQALLSGREAIGNDINPVAFCLTRAKTNAPSKSAVKQRLTALQNRFAAKRKDSEASTLSRFFAYAYAPHTLKQLLFLRESLSWRTSAVDCMLAGLVIGSLHGESNKSPSYLSNQMPRTISTKPEYSVRFWIEHGFEPPERDVFELLRKHLAFRYESDPPTIKGMAFESDFRNLPSQLRGLQKAPKLVVTSPPYLDTTNFEEDQWLRLWFLGGPPNPTYRTISQDDRHDNPDSYWRLIGDLWRMLGQVLAKRSHVVIRMGGKKLTPQKIASGLTANGCFSGRKVELIHSEVSVLKKRQTASFRPGAPGGGYEVDCCFAVS
ncbi:MAG: DNA methyltransferase [Bryobacteraceae bacterium]